MHTSAAFLQFQFPIGHCACYVQFNSTKEVIQGLLHLPALQLVQTQLGLNKQSPGSSLSVSRILHTDVQQGFRIVPKLSI